MTSIREDILNRLIKGIENSKKVLEKRKKNTEKAKKLQEKLDRLLKQQEEINNLPGLNLFGNLQFSEKKEIFKEGVGEIVLYFTAKGVIGFVGRKELRKLDNLYL